ncbi:MAG: methylmalonyl-CoA mutase family protein [Dehalococcoidia bacterium]
MSSNVDKMAEAYMQKVKRPMTWSGIPLEEEYRPEDLSGFDYSKSLGNAGTYPYTRGIHANMYRGRFWTTREVCGFGTPADSNKWLKFQINEGVGGLNVIFDLAGSMGLDSDHPAVEEDVGLGGCPFTSIQDMDELTADIPLDKVSFSLIAGDPMTLSAYVAVAQNRGIDISKLVGTIQNEPLHARWCAADARFYPLDLCYKQSTDIIEFCTRSIPKWTPVNINLYDLRETGINAVQEIAFGFSIAMAHLDAVIARGLSIDDFAKRFAFYCSCHIDLFEEVAKLRAARRMWARLIKEKYKAQNPQSWWFRFAVHTAGSSLTYQQPMNNIIRIAYEALAAVLGGAQSLHACSFDEPVALPTRDSQRLAVRTQQILAYETGVANVADPLGGSYYIETLTDKIEEEATKILDQIEEMGGAIGAIKSGWFENEINGASLRFQRQIENGDRILVGVNDFTIPPEEEPIVGTHQIPPESGPLQISNVKAFKASRDQSKVIEALRKVRAESQKGDKFNLMPVSIEALKAGATRAEIQGTIREVYGYPYDPLEVIEHPFPSIKE